MTRFVRDADTVHLRGCPEIVPARTLDWPHGETLSVTEIQAMRDDPDLVTACEVCMPDEETTT